MSQVQLPQSLIETHAEPFVVLDREFQLVAVNRAWESAFDQTRDDVLGRSIVDVCGISREAASLFSRQHTQAFRTLKPYTRVVNFHTSGGDSIKVRVRGYPLTDDEGNLYLGESMLPLDERVDIEGPIMLGESPAFTVLHAQLDRAASSDISVLLYGAIGTGKDLSARYIHAHSSRSQSPFVIVDSTVMNEDRFELELFGDERPHTVEGPVTGLLEMAHGGTLFLNDVNELSANLQAKLVRVLESGEFRRVGGQMMLEVDLRIICASSRSLHEMVEKGHFREDLFYRIAVYSIDLPALADRKDDIPVLAGHAMERINVAGGTDFELSAKAIDRLMQYSFPGNIRELDNVLQLAAAMCDDDYIDARHIYIIGGQQDQLMRDAQDAFTSGNTASSSHVPPLREIEARYVEELLKKFNGRRSEVARTLGVSERTLYRKLKQFGLN